MNRLQAHHLPATVGRVRDTLRTGDLDPRTDPDLLERYARYGDHPAFEAVIRRHGPMVLGVCRRVLGNAADADDAFQATFLVLIRRARSVRGEHLGPWLYGVAVRVALKARGRAARAAVRQTEVTDLIPDPSAPSDPPDWLPILDAELNALPAKYREPMVLCELQGATRAEAAGALGIPEGTLSSRLSRGRQLLRRRLLRHGTLLPTGGLVALFGAGSSGRATVPAALLTRTAGLAAVGTGVVPAGPARLTDEVMKDVLLTKLRLAGGALLTAGLMAAGLVAAWPGEAPGQSDAPRPAAKAVETPTGVKNPGNAAPARPDREAAQGFWVLEKTEVGKSARPELQREAAAIAGKIRFLVTGDIWWGMGPDDVIVPHKATLDPTKNPKWLDLTAWGTGGGGFPARSIYQLDGDHLRICLAESDQVRPAEFTTDEDSPLLVLHFRREPLPPPAGEKALVGSWETDRSLGIDPANGKTVQPPVRRVEMTSEFFFAFLPKEEHSDGVWVGGRYSVDTTKNPKWIDVDLVGGYPDTKVTKLYGCYDAQGGGLKLALGLSGKRVFRPLDLNPTPGGRADNLFFELKPAAAPFFDRSKDIAPVPAAKQMGSSLPKPHAPLPAGPLGSQGKDAVAALDRSHPRARELIREGKFAEAEACLRAHLRSAPEGPGATVARFLLGVCLVQQAAPSAKPSAANPAKNLEDALQLFKQVMTEIDARRQTKQTTEVDSWIRPQAALRVLQTYQQLGRPAEVLADGDKLRREVVGTADELIVLSLMYHAHRQRDRSEGALDVRRQMREVFDKLKDKPTAFWAKTGEYSREYWEDQWFAPDPPTR